MGHRRAKLTPQGRALIVRRVNEEGWTVSETAAAMGVARATCHKWLRRFDEEGWGGLEDRSSAPHHCPNALPPRQVKRILRARATRKVGPHLLTDLGHPRSTIYGVLRRHGCSRLTDFDRPSGKPIRYEKDRPGELIHIDTKKLGRIPAGGGHRINGDRRTRGRRNGYDFLHVAIDDHSRYSFVEVHDDEKGVTAAGFLLRAVDHFAEVGVSVEAVMSDNAKAYTDSFDFKDAMDEIGARHVRIRPYRPQTNGKAERFIQTMLREWAYVRLYRTNGDRLRALPYWLRRYNHRRPHTALGGRPPASRL